MSAIDAVKSVLGVVLVAGLACGGVALAVGGEAARPPDLIFPCPPCTYRSGDRCVPVPRPCRSLPRPVPAPPRVLPDPPPDMGQRSAVAAGACAAAGKSCESLPCCGSLACRGPSGGRRCAQPETCLGGGQPPPQVGSVVPVGSWGVL